MLYLDGRPVAVWSGIGVHAPDVELVDTHVRKKFASSPRHMTALKQPGTIAGDGQAEGGMGTPVMARSLPAPLDKTGLETGGDSRLGDGAWDGDRHVWRGARRVRPQGRLRAVRSL